jgi:hypothetical protein
MDRSNLLFIATFWMPATERRQKLPQAARALPGPCPPAPGNCVHVFQAGKSDVLHTGFDGGIGLLLAELGFVCRTR